jgi:Predicted acyltransferases
MGAPLTPRLQYDDFVGTQHFESFDGLRALAAILVIAYHFSGPSWPVSTGWLGVHLFFVLSGFLITTLLIREERRNGRVSLRDFWIRRVFRILPAYYVVLAITVGTILLQNQATEQGLLASIGWFATVNPDLAPTSLGFVVAWTIGVEQRFYLLWPVLAFVAVGVAGRRRVVVWAVATSTLLALTLLVSGSFVHYIVILMGCGLAMALHSRRGFAAARHLTSPLLTVGMIGVLLAALLAAPALQRLSGSDVVAILVFGAAVTFALPGLIASRPIVRVLSARPLVWLGRRSYSLYLVQMVASGVVLALFPFRGWEWNFGLTLGVAVLLADLLYRWVEKPGIELGRRWVARRRTRALPPQVHGGPAETAGR